jgi:hypothetical protein
MAENDHKPDRISLCGMNLEDALAKSLGTPSPRRFSLGDRVRVSQDYDLEYLRGSIGTITIGTPDRRPEGIYAVEFDGSTVSYGEGYSVAGMEFEGHFLEPVK